MFKKVLDISLSILAILVGLCFTVFLIRLFIALVTMDCIFCGG